MAAELDRTQRKFQLVDSLVDTMLLEEDSDLELPDRSRQVTDLILDLGQHENGILGHTPEKRRTDHGTGKAIGIQ